MIACCQKFPLAHTGDVFPSLSDSLRAKLGSALELLRLYQHKLQVLESMPICAASEAAQTARPYNRRYAEGCSNCTCMNPEATSAGPSVGPHEQANRPNKHETGNCSHPLAPGSMQPSAHSQPNARAIQSPMQLELRSDPGIGESGAFLHAPLPATVAQPVGTLCRESATQSAHDSGSLRGHSIRCGTKSCDAKIGASASEQGVSFGKCQKELAEDPWAFMRMSHSEGPKHAVRPFHGDLLSLVSDIDEMMSCSGKAPTNPSDAAISDSG